jgi:DedD protein
MPSRQFAAMRDANRLKERVELHLDRRQVTSIALVSLLLLGTVFALGVMVGKNLAPQLKAGPPAASLLDRLDARGVDAGGSDGLTFQEELTRRTPPEHPAPTPIVRAPPPKPERAPAPAINLPSVPEEPVAPAASATAGPGPQKDAGSIDPEMAEVAIEEAHKDRTSLRTVPVSKPAVATGGSAAFFTVQVKATQSQGEAEKFAAKLHGKGYHAMVAEADVPGKGHWYRVRVGHFESRAEAEHYLGDFERETHLTAFVTAGAH